MLLSRNYNCLVPQDYWPHFKNNNTYSTVKMFFLFLYDKIINKIVIKLINSVLLKKIIV